MHRILSLLEQGGWGRAAPARAEGCVSWGHAPQCSRQGAAHHHHLYRSHVQILRAGAGGGLQPLQIILFYFSK